MRFMVILGFVGFELQRGESPEARLWGISSGNREQPGGEVDGVFGFQEDGLRMRRVTLGEPGSTGRQRSDY